MAVRTGENMIMCKFRRGCMIFYSYFLFTVRKSYFPFSCAISAERIAGIATCVKMVISRYFPFLPNGFLLGNNRVLFSKN